MGVERLLLPAIPQLLETWTGSFGFTVMSNSDRLELVENSILSFQGTIMCQKVLNVACSSPQDQSAPSMSNSVKDLAENSILCYPEISICQKVSISIQNHPEKLNGLALTLFCLLSTF
jgi:hypothetical protein